MKEAAREVEDFQRARLQELLAQCTESQRDVHRRMYIGGVKTSQLTWAIQQCLNTVKVNQSSPKEVA